MVLSRNVRLVAYHQYLINDLEERIHPWICYLEDCRLISFSEDLANEYNDDLSLVVEEALKEQLF